METRTAIASRSQGMKGRFEVKLVSNEVKQPNFQAIPEVAYKDDPTGALSMIPPKVVMIQDIRKCYNRKVGSIGDLELKEAYRRLCKNGKLKDEYQIIECKGLTHALDMPTVFKIECIKIVLSRIHDGFLWLEGGPVKTTKRVVCRVTSCPTLEQSRAIRSDANEIIEKNIGAM